MKPVAFADLDPRCWDEVCAASRDAWLFHRAEWVRLERDVFAREDRSFALVDGDGRALAVVPLQFMELGLGTWVERVLVSGMPRMTGPALRDDLPADRRREVRGALMRHLHELAAAVDADRIELNAQTLAPAVREGPLREVPWFVEEHGFHLGMQMSQMGIAPAPGMYSCASDQVVFLDGDEEQQFAALDPACRRAVRKAQKAGLSSEVLTGAAAFTAYRALAEHSARRTGEVLPPEAYHRALLDEFAQRGHACALLVRQGEQPVAGVLLLIDKCAASFGAGASDPEALSMRVNDLAHWEVIRWCRAQGFECYRLGPSFPSLPREWPVATVSRFKTKFGARGLPVVQASWFRRPERYLELGIATLRVLCAPRQVEAAS